MIPIPNPEDYDVSPTHGFLSAHVPLESLPDPYYQPWEFAAKNLQGLILSKRLRPTIDRLPILSTDLLTSEAEWRRAYSVLSFLAHAYIWGGDRPMEWIPPSITVPFLRTCSHLQLPPVATYAGLVLWNWKPIFTDERVDTLANLDMIETFTGSLDEKWFYLISVAIEAHGAPLIPLMLHAMECARRNDRATVTESLRKFAETLDELGGMLQRMYDNCDPHVFYHRIRPFLAGSKNMADAGLPHGVIFDDGGPINKQRYVQYSGGSNAQSSLIQFFDIVLSVEHRPTGQKATTSSQHPEFGGPPTTKPRTKAGPAPASENFIQEMRTYMPGPHARFLAACDRVANLRAFVHANRFDHELVLAFDACLAMLSAFRDKHIQMVSRYIIIKSREAQKNGPSAAEAAKEKEKKKQQQQLLATPETITVDLPIRPKSATGGDRERAQEKERKNLRGTGGTSLIPFLRQARDETGEPAVDEWAKRLLSRGRLNQQYRPDKAPEGWETKDGGEGAGDRRKSRIECQGLASVWHIDDSEGGGLCLV